MAYENGRHVGVTPTGTRPATEEEQAAWTYAGQRWNWRENPDLLARQVFETSDQELINSWRQKNLTLGKIVAERHKASNLSTLALGGNKDKWVIMTIFRNLLLELDNLGPHAQTANHVGDWCRVRQIGKVIFQLMTRGRWYDEDGDDVVLTFEERTWHKFGENMLRNRYPAWLIDLVYDCIDYQQPLRDRQRASEIVEILNNFLEYKPEIPKGLSFEEQAVYHQLTKVFGKRCHTKKAPRNVLVITDLAKDYDDLVALTILKEFHRLGLILLKGFVANLKPAHERARFGLGALQALDIGDINIAEGSDGTDKRNKVHDHEFVEAEKFFMVRGDIEFEDGQDLIRKVCQQAPRIREEDKISLLLISSLRDINTFAQAEPRLLKSAVSDIVLQGGYTLKNNHLIPDDKAANNAFDLSAATNFHTWIKRSAIPSTSFTKTATFAVDIKDSWLRSLEDTGHILGKHLRQTQLAQERSYYTQAASGKPFAPFMTQEWYLKNKTTWWDHHEPGTPLPDDVEDVIPYLNKIVIYDALAAVGVAGEDVLEAFDILELPEAKDELEARHRVVGIAAEVLEEAVQEKIGHLMEDGSIKSTFVEAMPAVTREAVAGLNGPNMAAIIKALGRGSLLACMQGLTPAKVQSDL